MTGADVHEQDLLAPTVLGAVARRKRLTALVVVLFALLGLAYAFTQKATATASESIVVQPAGSTALGTTTVDATFLPDQVDILGFLSTADAAAALLAKSDPSAGLTGDDILAGQEILGSTDSNLITVKFSNSDPAVAKAAADSIVKAYANILATTAAEAQQSQAERLSQSIATLDKQIAAAGGPNTTVGAQLATTRASLAASQSALTVAGATGTSIQAISPGRVPTPHRTLAPAAGLVLGAIVGLIPAVGLAYFLAMKRRRFTDRFQPRLVLQRRMLSEIPDFKLEGLKSDVPTADALESAAAEAFRFVGTSLDSHDYDSGPLILAVTGANSLDGKTSVAANLAVTFARRGRRTVALDADLDGQGLGFLLLGDKRHAPGLAEVLAGRGSLDALLQHVPADVGADLLVLPSGLLHGPSVTETVSQESLGQVLNDLRGSAEVIVLDIPSPIQVAYASSMLRAVGDCVVVVPHGSDPVRLNELAIRLTGLNVDAIGYVYTKAPLRKELGLASRYVDDQRRVPVAVSPRASMKGKRATSPVAGGASAVPVTTIPLAEIPLEPMTAVPRDANGQSQAGRVDPELTTAVSQDRAALVGEYPGDQDLDADLLAVEDRAKVTATRAATGSGRPDPDAGEEAQGLGWPTMFEDPWVGSER